MSTEKKRKTVETFSASPELEAILTGEFESVRETFNGANNALSRVKKSMERAGLPKFTGEEKTVLVTGVNGRTIAEIRISATAPYTVEAGWKNTLKVVYAAPNTQPNQLMELGTKLAQMQAELAGIKLTAKV